MRLLFTLLAFLVVSAALAQADDIVLLAGKGHETYQEVAGQRIDYDERALALALSKDAL